MCTLVHVKAPELASTSSQTAGSVHTEHPRHLPLVSEKHDMAGKVPSCTRLEVWALSCIGRAARLVDLSMTSPGPMVGAIALNSAEFSTMVQYIPESSRMALGTAQ